jgi:hypothetical protein
MQIRARHLLRNLGFSLLALAFCAAVSNSTASAPDASRAAVQLVQYNPYYPPSNRPPCNAYGSPFRGAARGAAGGAIIGGIAGNAGRGAAIGAGIGLVGGAVRNSNARANGYCY